MNIQHRLIGVAAASVIALAGCATSPGYGGGYAGAPMSGSTANCYDCGVVTRIESLGGGMAPASGTAGAIIGGVVGAAAGRTIANDESKGRQNTATVAGAAAGAVAGAAIQRNMTGGSGSYNVYVRMNDGRTTMVTQSDLGSVREGSMVRVYNGRVWTR
ncbi:glycine zipper 2TM domain-containing protein [Lysobacter xanthus]